MGFNYVSTLRGKTHSDNDHLVGSLPEISIPEISTNIYLFRQMLKKKSFSNTTRR